MKRRIEEFASRDEHSNYDMTIVAIMSHGQGGNCFSSDGFPVQVEWILKQFNNDYCPDLNGKPKFFIFQACR